MITPKIEFRKSQVFVRNCENLPWKTRKAVREATLAFAYLVLNSAKWLCPVDTGRLRASLSTNWTDSGMTYGKTAGKVTVKAGRKPPSPTDGVGQPPKDLHGYYAAVGTNVEYAEPVEGRSPYLWPALAMNKEKYKAMLERILKMELAKI